MNNGVGCLALRGMFGCVLNNRKLPYCGSAVTPQTQGSVDYPSTCGVLVNVG